MKLPPQTPDRRGCDQQAQDQWEGASGLRHCRKQGLRKLFFASTSAGSNCFFHALIKRDRGELQAEELRQQFIAAEFQRTLDDGKPAIMDIDAAMEALAEPSAIRDASMPSS